ncbi:MAG: rhomboid family intramembrane serine protease [Polyangiaceae bacterium]
MAVDQRNTWACVDDGIFEGSHLEKCPICGADVYDPMGKDRVFITDYVHTLQSSRRMRQWWASSAIGLVLTLVLTAVAGAALLNPLTFFGLAALAFIMIDRVRFFRLPEPRQRLEKFVSSGNTVWIRVLTSTPFFLFVFISVTAVLGVFPGISAAFTNGEMVPENIRHGRALWTLVTAMFLHEGYAHLAGNSFFLLMYGIPIDLRLGRLKCFAIFLLAALAGNLAEAWLTATPSEHSLGASGGILGIFGASLLVDPRFRSGPGFERNRAIARFFFGVVAMVVISSIDYGTNDNVAWRAHLGGLLVGCLIGAAWSQRDESADFKAFQRLLKGV